MSILKDPIITRRLDFVIPEYKDFCESDFFTTTTENYVTGYNIKHESIEYFFNSLVLYFLFFFDKESWKSFIVENCSLSTEDSSEIVESILAFLPKKLKDAQFESYKIINDNESVSNTEILKVRTMESDVDKVQGYGAYRELYPDERLIGNEEFTHQSSQDDALARPKMADLPSYKQGE